MQSCIATMDAVEDTCNDARDEDGWEVKQDKDAVTIRDEKGQIIYSAISKGSTWLVWYSTDHFEMFDPPELDN